LARATQQESSCLADANLSSPEESTIGVWWASNCAADFGRWNGFGSV